MKTFALLNGDLVLGPGGYQTVSGETKVRLDLALATVEHLGNDRFHPRWGSILANFIGEPMNEEISLLIRSEITRLVHNYMMVQTEALEAQQQSVGKVHFSTAELVTGIETIDIRQEIDRYRIRIVFNTLARQGIELISTVGV